MSNLLTTPQWHEDINQVDVTEPIVGGDGGNMNLATRQLAESLAWLKQQIENNPIEAYQVGDIYTTTLNHASSAEVAINKGYGTWARYAEGRTLVGMIDIPDYVGRYSSIGNEFGENEHQLTVAEMPSHKHGNGVALDSLTNQDIAAGFRGTQPILPDTTVSVMGDSPDGKYEGLTETIGYNQPHKNIQPSIVVAYWLRTA